MQKKAFGLIGASIVLASTLVWLSGANHAATAALSQTLMPTAISDPILGDLDLRAVAEIDLSTYPVIPEISDHAQQLYRNSITSGTNPHAFIKVGDCMTATPFFLYPIGEGNYGLGANTDLQRVIDHFISGDLNAFSRISQAAAGGFNSASILDSLWANPMFCESGETPLACEIRATNPSIALIMFGTNDVFYLDEFQFDFFLRSIVTETIRNNVLPILSTFPHRPEFPEKSDLYNQIVVKIALDFDIPLINLWRALESLPHRGVDPEDTTHLSAPADGAVCHFSDENMQWGFTVRNLLTLQTLDAVLRAVNGES